jgi:arylsulfatase A-like enzyme
VKRSNSGAIQRWRNGVLAFLLAGWLAPGCTPADPHGVILISIDTLRADRLGAYGYARDTSPALDVLARTGALFERVVAESSWTLPSHVTLLSGLEPASHGVSRPIERPAPEVRLLAEVLRDSGYRTLGLTDGVYLGAAYGFGRGFDAFDDADKGLAKSLERAESWLSELPEREPFFVFLHTYDVHCPYAPSPGYAARFRSEDAEFVETEGRCGNPHFNAMDLSPGQTRHLSDHYDASIREADDQLGAFLARLAPKGVLEHAVLVVTSDHGEEFGEHGRIGHERTLYREALLVPLIVVGPGVPRTRVRAAVGLADVVPTILDLVGIRAPEPVDGRSLVPLMRGAPAQGADGDPRVSELAWQLRLRSILTDELHLILDVRTGEPLLFSVVDDPLETRNLAPLHPDRVETLRALLERHEATARPRRAAPLERLPPAQAEQLRRLGYVW